MVFNSQHLKKNTHLTTKEYLPEIENSWKNFKIEGRKKFF